MPERPPTRVAQQDEQWAAAAPGTEGLTEMWFEEHVLRMREPRQWLQRRVLLEALEYIAKGRLVDAYMLTRELVAAPNPDVSSVFYHAKMCLQLGDVEEALGHFTWLKAQLPNSFVVEKLRKMSEDSVSRGRAIRPQPPLAGRKVFEQVEPPAALVTDCCGNLTSWRADGEFVAALMTYQTSDAKAWLDSYSPADRGVLSLLLLALLSDVSDERKGDTNLAHLRVVDLMADYILPAANGTTPRAIDEKFLLDLDEAFTWSAPFVKVQRKDGSEVPLKLSQGRYKMMPSNHADDTDTSPQFCPPAQVADAVQSLLALIREYEPRTCRYDAGETSSGKCIPAEAFAAWAHHQLALIRPFHSANGRVARALASALLLRAGLLPFAAPQQSKIAYMTALRDADDGKLNTLADYVAKQQEVLKDGCQQVFENSRSGEEPAVADGTWFEDHVHHLRAPGQQLLRRGLMRADSLRREGRLRDAFLASRELISLPDPDPSALYMHAAISHPLKEPTESLECLEKLAALFPNSKLIGQLISQTRHLVESQRQISESLVELAEPLPGQRIYAGVSAIPTPFPAADASLVAISSAVASAADCGASPLLARIFPLPQRVGAALAKPLALAAVVGPERALPAPSAAHVVDTDEAYSVLRAAAELLYGGNFSVLDGAFTALDEPALQRAHVMLTAQEPFTHVVIPGSPAKLVKQRQGKYKLAPNDDEETGDGGSSAQHCPPGRVAAEMREFIARCNDYAGHLCTYDGRSSDGCVPAEAAAAWAYAGLLAVRPFQAANVLVGRALASSLLLRAGLLPLLADDAAIRVAASNGDVPAATRAVVQLQRAALERLRSSGVCSLGDNGI
eukprot:TRINITY_DN33_c0_g1_i1.p1 TRINITY_DN33_c0_g1~~TRINITY_DN33_c0_g1_i1.p1  ORF type:complete len:881 (+),score=203.16 TRINITY_DN33_c0_g1_i1:94-2643(+)